jgi:two-component system response regulator VicR
MKRLKALVADDIRDIRDMLRITLEPQYDVVVARNGEEAWELFNAEKPDIVLTPVIIITAATKERELSDAFWKMAAGSDAFITKPFSPAAVLETVARCLNKIPERERYETSLR